MAILGSVLLVACGLCGGLVAAAFFSRRPIDSGLAMFGLTIGVFLGLSASPVLGTAITALFALLATLSGVDKAAPPSSEVTKASGESPPVSSDSRFSQTTKATKETLGQLGCTWLMPFAAAILTGAIVGIMIRTNDLLTFRGNSLTSDLQALGFTREQVNEIMNYRFSTASGRLPNLRDKYRSLGFSENEVSEIMKRQASVFSLDPTAMPAVNPKIIDKATTLLSVSPPMPSLKEPSSPSGSVMYSGAALSDLANTLFTKVETLPDDRSTKAEVNQDAEARSWLGIVEQSLDSSATLDTLPSDGKISESMDLSTLYRLYLKQLLHTGEGQSVKNRHHDFEVANIVNVIRERVQKNAGVRGSNSDLRP